MRLGYPRRLGTYRLANSVLIFVYSKAYQILSDPVSNPFVSHPHLYHPRHTYRPLSSPMSLVYFAHPSRSPSPSPQVIETSDVKFPVKEVRFALSDEATKNNWEGHVSPNAGNSPPQSGRSLTPNQLPSLFDTPTSPGGGGVELKDLRSVSSPISSNSSQVGDNTADVSSSASAVSAASRLNGDTTKSNGISYSKH